MRCGPPRTASSQPRAVRLFRGLRRPPCTHDPCLSRRQIRNVRYGIWAVVSALWNITGMERALWNARAYRLVHIYR